MRAAKPLLLQHAVMARTREFLPSPLARINVYGHTQTYVYVHRDREAQKHVYMNTDHTHTRTHILRTRGFLASKIRMAALLNSVKRITAPQKRDPCAREELHVMEVIILMAFSLYR